MPRSFLVKSKKAHSYHEPRTLEDDYNRFDIVLTHMCEDSKIPEDSESCPDAMTIDTSGAFSPESHLVDTAEFSSKSPLSCGGSVCDRSSDYEDCWRPPSPSASPADSEKSFSPSADETQPFAVPFRTYAWGSYSGSEIRQLVEQRFSQHPALDLERSTTLNYYSERVVEPPLLNERGPGSGIYGNYDSSANPFERATGPGLYVDRNTHGNGADMKTDTARICSRLILNGAFKCIKCSKDIVRSLGSGLLVSLIEEVMKKERDPAHCQSVITLLERTCNAGDTLDILLKSRISTLYSALNVSCLLLHSVFLTLGDTKAPSLGLALEALQKLPVPCSHKQEQEDSGMVSLREPLLEAQFDREDETSQSFALWSFATEILCNMEYINVLLSSDFLFFQRKDESWILKGLHLYVKSLESLVDNSISVELLNMKPVHSVLQKIVKIMTECPIQHLKAKATMLFKLFIEKLNGEAKHKCFMCVMKTSQHTGVESFILKNIQNHLVHSSKGYDIAKPSEISTYQREKELDRWTGLCNIAENYIKTLCVYLSMSKSYYGSALKKLHDTKKIMAKVYTVRLSCDLNGFHDILEENHLQ
ncbi:hypothetical protein P4O66_009778 [Electrophorus voltai]|uniref:Uncharacterized protein n=1 Tax=Electrophorus voltai TaxID=2609070 RepID=A0AAD8ZEV0_9TELE|nr:hypothetical protein P4O66_009778 [Electrophorus voltai]